MCVLGYNNIKTYLYFLLWTIYLYLSVYLFPWDDALHVWIKHNNIGIFLHLQVNFDKKLKCTIFTSKVQWTHLKF